MTRVKDIRRADKNVFDWGRWENAKMPASIFPLSRRRSNSFRLGTAYRWRLVRFQACGGTFRLLLAFGIAKQQYRAILASEGERDMRVLASYEFHGTHPGWHLLTTCADVAAVPEGVMIGPWQRRVPGARMRHRDLKFWVKDDGGALEIAARFFCLYRAEGKLL